MLRRFVVRFLARRKEHPIVRSNIIWSGKMPPFSQDRSAWIEARLFCLARMAGELANRASYYEARLHIEGARAASHAAYSKIQEERILLMVERQVIEDHNRESKNGC